MRFKQHILPLVTSVLFLLMFSTTNSVQAAEKDTINYTSTCFGETIIFNSNLFNKAPFPDKIIWTFGDPASGSLNTSVNPTNYAGRHVFTAEGTYRITLHVEDFSGLYDLVDTILIVQPINYNFGPDIFRCKGDTVMLTAPLVSHAEYTWNDKANTTTSTLRLTESGTYTVKINGCTVTDTVGVFFSNKPEVKLGNDHIMCAGETLTLTGASQNGSYQWLYNGQLLPDTTSQLLTTAPGGEYILLLNVLGCGSYSDTVNITYSNHSAPAFSLGPDTLLCPKQTFSLTASAPGATGYNWSTGSTQPTISISSPGSYYAFVSINNLCEVTDTVNVTYRGDKKLDLRDTAICKGETLVLDADFGTGKYDWTVVPPVRDDQGVTDQSTFYVYKPGLYMVTAQVGECIYKDTALVKFNDSLKLRLYPSRDTSLCYGEPWLLSASGNAESYIWQDGKRGTQYSVEKPGTYYVIAKNGCGADTVTVNIAFKTCECELLLPTAFTPNGDGRNDVFRPLHACNMSDFTLRIFNRFGEQLFYSRTPQSGWDGTYNGRPQVTGTFVWSASYINTDNNRRYEKKGTVALIR